MFPLGSVLFPHAVLPLHVFEPRYRALSARCLETDREFGVVLIERGSEVGGGDVRFEVGTVARIVQAGKFPDGRYALVAVGTTRLRVQRWLPDDPYPQAEVTVVATEAALDPDVGSRRERLVGTLRRVAGLRAELAEPGPTIDVELDDDAVRAGFEAAALTGFGALDAQRLLELDDPGERLDRIAALLDDETELLELRLRGS